MSGESFEKPGCASCPQDDGGSRDRLRMPRTDSPRWGVEFKNQDGTLRDTADQVLPDLADRLAMPDGAEKRRWPCNCSASGAELILFRIRAGGHNGALPRCRRSLNWQMQK